MVPLGYGTQTAGSVIRPGAFNGVVAYKGTFGWADMTGIKPYAPSLDTLGFFAREANDLALVRAAYGHAPADPPKRPPRIGLCRTLWWDEAEPYNRSNLVTAARALRSAGARLHSWRMPESWQTLLDAQNNLMTSEATKAYAQERARFPRLISPSLTLALQAGDGVSGAQLSRARRAKRRALADLDQAWQRFDFLLAPSAKGEAPAGLGYTGDPLFNRFWTLLGVPCIALPFGSGPFDLPLSLQLVGPRRADDQLVAWARWVEQRLS
jgi:amidase